MLKVICFGSVDTHVAERLRDLMDEHDTAVRDIRATVFRLG